jgi:hypothetical protein
MPGKRVTNVFARVRGPRGKKPNNVRGPGHRELNRRARQFGRAAAGRPADRKGFIRLELQPQFRRNLLLRRLRLAGERDDPTPIGKTWDDLWRDAWPAQDELVSTSTVREFFTGVFETRPYGKLKQEEIEVIDAIADSISVVRLPTVYSGYSLDREVMQHPANRDRAVFGDPFDTSAAHAARDTQRKNYVLDAMQREVDAGGDMEAIARAGCKAAIEFTLNYFTAPITASNVLPFSRRANVDLDDVELQEQVAGRERMKDIYEELGGVLRPALAGETPGQALERPWEGPPQNNVFLLAPPSPRRLARSAPADDDPPMLQLADGPAQADLFDATPTSLLRQQMMRE